MGVTWLWVNKDLWEVCIPYDIKINIQHEMMSHQQQTNISCKNSAKWHHAKSTILSDVNFICLIIS